MSSDSTLDPLLFDLVEWISREPRAYAEVIDAWRTSCPRLTVWENAIERDLVMRSVGPEKRPYIAVTPHGLLFLAERKRRNAAASEFS